MRRSFLTHLSYEIWLFQMHLAEVTALCFQMSANGSNKATQLTA